jgi:hypothetical protein
LALGNNSVVNFEIEAVFATRELDISNRSEIKADRQVAVRPKWPKQETSGMREGQILTDYYLR